MNDKKSPFYVPGTWYAITLCPSDAFQYFGKANRFKSFYSKIYEALLPMHFKYKMYIELSEPRGTIRGDGPRLHAHGIMYFPDVYSVKKFLLYDLYLLTRIGILEIDTIDDMLRWQVYCRKHISILHFKPLTNNDNLFMEACEARGVSPDDVRSAEVLEIKPLCAQPSVKSVDESCTQDSGFIDSDEEL